MNHSGKSKKSEQSIEKKIIMDDPRQDQNRKRETTHITINLYVKALRSYNAIRRISVLNGTVLKRTKTY